MTARNQLDLFTNALDPNDDLKSSTFTDNLSLPIHRWFRYSAGFSALWVRQLIAQHKRQGRTSVFDPFAGSGTVLLEAELSGVPCKGVEAHPFIARMARAKLHWHQNPAEFHNYALVVLRQAQSLDNDVSEYPRLIHQCYPPDVLSRLDSLRRAWTDMSDGSPLSELTWLALASILRGCSPVGTAQWQYVLPGKAKANPHDPYDAFLTKIHLMRTDMAARQRQIPRSRVELHCGDARQCTAVADRSVDLVITSPPYANNYDYADATRLEMTFFGEVQGWGDLHESVRRHLVRSCTQRLAKMTGDTSVFLEEPLLQPIHSDITKVCKRLETERESHGGKKPYHAMIAGYFYDLAQVWVALRRITAEGALVCFVIGDSAPYGVHVPVERWLGELALAAGFRSFYFEKTRDRNVKWKNRKHRVPLHEGRLWVEG